MYHLMVTSMMTASFDEVIEFDETEQWPINCQTNVSDIHSELPSHE